MERRSSLSRDEAALERLLERIDAAIDEYTRARRSRYPPPDDDLDVRFERSWEAWWALPLSIRDWLLWFVPGWWALSPGIFRRFLLRTARLIVRNGLAPRVALRRAATQLRLPPPRRTTRLARATARRTAQQFRAAAIGGRHIARARRAGRTESRAAPLRRSHVSTQQTPRYPQPAARRSSVTARQRAPIPRGRVVRMRLR